VSKDLRVPNAYGEAVACPSRWKNVSLIPQPRSLCAILLSIFNRPLFPKIKITPPLTK
jgi:hypothetical protein